MGCDCQKIIQIASSGGGGPFTVQADVPSAGQITVTDTASGNSFVLVLNNAIKISDADNDTQVVTVESGGAAGGDRIDFIVDGNTVGSVEILTGGTHKWTLNGIVDPEVFAASGITTVQRDALEGITAGYLMYNTDVDSFQQYNGTSWDTFSVAKDVSFADDTTVAPATSGLPTIAEIETFVTGASISDVFLYYTGSDTSTDAPTHTYIIDASGSAILVSGFEATLEVIDSLTPSAQDTVPNLSATPQDATKVKFFIDHDFDYASMITSDAAGAITVSASIFVTYGFNVETSNKVIAVYHKKP